MSIIYLYIVHTHIYIMYIYMRINEDVPYMDVDRQSVRLFDAKWNGTVG